MSRSTLSEDVDSKKKKKGKEDTVDSCRVRLSYPLRCTKRRVKRSRKGNEMEESLGFVIRPWHRLIIKGTYEGNAEVRQQRQTFNTTILPFFFFH